MPMGDQALLFRSQGPQERIGDDQGAGFREMHGGVDVNPGVPASEDILHRTEE
ncbi:MAG: hypothetical protein NTV79_07190 [Candidatus Aureabacteria bacterium]|nr:hypothetical protein [Candidatus Auribacterota bacterium]